MLSLKNYYMYTKFSFKRIFSFCYWICRESIRNTNFIVLEDFNNILTLFETFNIIKYIFFIINTLKSIFFFNFLLIFSLYWNENIFVLYIYIIQRYFNYRFTESCVSALRPYVHMLWIMLTNKRILHNHKKI